MNERMRGGRNDIRIGTGGAISREFWDDNARHDVE
jgi:hypothetical protein